MHRGDFNATHFSSERLGEAHFCLVMVEFSHFIVYQGLIDISLVGGEQS